MRTDHHDDEGRPGPSRPGRHRRPHRTPRAWAHHHRRALAVTTAGAAITIAYTTACAHIISWWFPADAVAYWLAAATVTAAATALTLAVCAHRWAKPRPMSHAPHMSAAGGDDGGR